MQGEGSENLYTQDSLDPPLMFPFIHIHLIPI